MAGNKPTQNQITALRRFKVSDAEIAKMSFQDASSKLDKLITDAQKRDANSGEARHAYSSASPTSAGRKATDQAQKSPPQREQHPAEPPSDIDLRVRPRHDRAKLIVATSFKITLADVTIDNELVGRGFDQLWSEEATMRIQRNKERNIQSVKEG